MSKNMSKNMCEKRSETRRAGTSGPAPLAAVCLAAASLAAAETPGWEEGRENGRNTGQTSDQSVEGTVRSYSYGNLSIVEGDVWHQRADDFGAHEAERGSPFLPGDRIWTREPGQVELRFAGRITAWMDEGTKLDYVEGDSPHRLGFWTGSLIVAMDGGGEVVVETPGGTFAPQGEGEYRTDLLDDGRTVQFVVYSGIATVSTEWGSVLVGANQRTVASEGTAPAPAEEYLGNDAFFAWTDDRQRRFVPADDVPYEELPDEVQEYAHDLNDHGRWHRDAHLGWVWYPTVSSGWAPYRLGRWAHTPFGLTWVSYDPWGWAPFHYGRWGYSPHGWYWLPGSVWGPAWVSWSNGYDWIGWSPLGYYGFPVYPFYQYSYYGNNYWASEGTESRNFRRRGQILGKAVPRRSAVNRAWSFTSRDAVGRPASRRRLAASRLRDVENALVLERGAVLDRGFRQRAVGTTAMTRSAKATTRRLSNSRIASDDGARSLGSAMARSDRSTPRAQRVGVPSSAARARSARSSSAAEGARSRLGAGLNTGRETAGAPTADRGRGQRPGQRLTPRDGTRSASPGRTATRGRPAAAPRPRATGRTGGAGARGAGATGARRPSPRTTTPRRPSTVRPAAPRSGASSAGRSAAPRGRPSSGARSRPGSASRSRPSAGSRSRPSAGSRSQPSAGSRSRPGSASRSRPSAGSRSRPSAGSRSRPSAGSRSRPGGASANRAGGAARFRGGSSSGGSRGGSAAVSSGGGSRGGSGSAVSPGVSRGGGSSASRSGASRGSSGGSRRPNNN